MRIEEYLKTLPEDVISGEDVRIPPRAFREMFRLAGLGRDDVFYHLGCSDAAGIRIASEEFHVRRAVGIDIDPEKVRKAKEEIGEDCPRAEMVCGDITEADLGGATAILFWFADEGIVHRMLKRFEGLGEGTRIVTVWGPLPGCLPHKTDFPYVVNRIPLRRAQSVQEQVREVFGTECVDFVTAWEHAERYTRALAGPEIKNDRFLTIIQTLVIWINAKNMGVACGDGIPESIRTYISIMKTHFDIDFGPMLDE